MTRVMPTGRSRKRLESSLVWLERFQYDAMEWVWRALNYGKAPELRSATA